MDLTRAPLSFRVRKAARYVRLYGLPRTAVKVRGQYHMRGGRSLPGRSPKRRTDAHVGIIGCGNFAYTALAYFLVEEHGAVVRGVMDVHAGRARSLARRYGAHYSTSEAERLIDDEAIDLIYVASNHASHADYAVRALEAGKSVHIEKPHCTSEAQLDRLCQAAEASPGRIQLGFNRPLSPLGVRALELLRSGSGPMVLDWFVVGHEIPPEHWYNDPGEGGRVLGNLCHWSDFALASVPQHDRYPIEITPTRGTRSDEDIVVTYAFGGGAVTTISFCAARGHAFEGVRERLTAHRGDVLFTLEDFATLRVDQGRKRQRQRLRFRDHGHRATTLSSYAMTEAGGGRPGRSITDIEQTGRLFLRTREALESGKTVRIDRPGR